MHKQFGYKTGETHTCAMFTTDGNRGLFPVVAETLLGRNYFCCHPQWPSTSCCFFTASDTWPHGLWSFLALLLQASACCQSITTDMSSQLPAKGRSQPAWFSGNMLNKTAAIAMLSAPISWCEASSLALKALAFCRSQKGVSQLQQDLLEPSS